MFYSTVTTWKGLGKCHGRVMEKSLNFILGFLYEPCLAISLWNYLVNYLSKIWFKSSWGQWVNSSPPSATYMRQWTGSAFVRVMSCHLFGAKALPEPMLAYCQLDSWEQISVKFELEFYHFHSRKYVWICCLPKWRPFCPGGGELVGSCWLVPIDGFITLVLPHLCQVTATHWETGHL